MKIPRFPKDRHGSLIGQWGIEELDHLEHRFETLERREMTATGETRHDHQRRTT